MSKLESPMTRWYWHTVSGLLLEEFCLVNRTATCGGRWVDALILPERHTRIAGRSETIDIAPGECAILVQTKASQRILKAADQILKAGTTSEQE